MPKTKKPTEQFIECRIYENDNEPFKVYHLPLENGESFIQEIKDPLNKKTISKKLIITSGWITYNGLKFVAHGTPPLYYRINQLFPLDKKELHRLEFFIRINKCQRQKNPPKKSAIG